MGGYGSGWYRYDKKRCVEDGLRLRASGYKPIVIEAHADRRSVGGQSAWSREGTRTASIGFTYLPGADFPDQLAARGGGTAGRLRLTYTQTSDDEQERLSYELAVEVRPCHFGGWRLYFRCPLSKRGRACDRRGEKLYLPPGSRYFGCRTCHELTYRSAQEAHHFDGLFKRIGLQMGVDAREVERVLSLRI